MGKTTSQLLMKQAPSIHVNSKFPIDGYYERAERLLRQAMIYRAGQDQFNLFVIQARFSSLLLDTIPKHKSFAQSKERYKALNKPLCRAISELESLKQLLDKSSEEEVDLARTTSATTTTTTKSSSASTPPAQKTKRSSAPAPDPLALDDLSIGPGAGAGTGQGKGAFVVGGNVQVLSDQEQAELAKAAAQGGLSIQTSPSFLGSNGGVVGGDMSAPVMYPSPSGAPISAPVVPRVSGNTTATATSTSTQQQHQQQSVVVPVPSAPPMMQPPPPPPPMVLQAQAPPPPPPPVSIEPMGSLASNEGMARQIGSLSRADAQPLPPPPPPPPSSPSPYQDEPQMTAHKPKVVENMPTKEVADMDYMNLADRLKHYGLKEKKVKGDGNCQFRSLSDQLFGSMDRHAEVRRMTINQLKSQSDLYKPYVPEDYDKYVETMSKDGEWGDHVTLQAAADVYGRRICVLSSYKTNFIIDIKPQKSLHPRVLWLSFWAEVHYNSLYPSSSL